MQSEWNDRLSKNYLFLDSLSNLNPFELGDGSL